MASSIDSPVVFYPDESAALAACAAIDASMKLPNARMTRWTDPLPQEDGTWAVQYPDAATVTALKVAPTKVSRDLIATRKRSVEEIAEAVAAEAIDDVKAEPIGDAPIATPKTKRVRK